MINQIFSTEKGRNIQAANASSIRDALVGVYSIGQAVECMH